MATKAQLQQEVEELRETLDKARIAYRVLKEENAQLTARLTPSNVVQMNRPTSDAFPLRDKRGWPYRQEGRVRVYPANPVI